MAGKERLVRFIETHVAREKRERWLRLVEYRHGVPTIAKALTNPRDWVDTSTMLSCSRNELFGQVGRGAIEPLRKAFSACGEQDLYVLTPDGEASILPVAEAIGKTLGRAALLIGASGSSAAAFGDVEHYVSRKLFACLKGQRSIGDAKR